MTGIYQPFHEPNKNLKYINNAFQISNNSVHIRNGISELSADKDSLEQHAPNYNNAPKKAGYAEQPQYTKLRVIYSQY